MQDQARPTTSIPAKLADDSRNRDIAAVLQAQGLDEELSDEQAIALARLLSRPAPKPGRRRG